MEEERKEAVASPQAAQTVKPLCTFLGDYEHGLDGKGRVIVPAAFRASLGAQFCICLDPRFKNIAVYPQEAWEAEYARLQRLAAIDVNVQRIIKMFCKYTFADCECDAQGRILLPQKLRARCLEDAKLVDISGSGSYISIMRTEDAEAEENEFFEQFGDPLEYQAHIGK